ncbi:MAG TPA: MBOAT family O-acyltransferase, partial [Gemmata sp.]
MLFHSQAYLVFLLAVLVAYWALPWHRARVYLLVGASFAFYAFWSEWLALLVTGTTVMDYLLARAMDASRRHRVRQVLLCTSLTVNLGLLCYFKYVNFFLDALRESLALVGGSASFPYLSVVVPFGISFYTFEAISYAVDVYRRKIPAEKSLPNFLLFILFFPHLVAGPIVRAPDFLPQVRREKRFSWLRVQVGVEFLLLGLFKKLVIADAMAIYSDPIISPDSDPAKLRTSAAWLGVVAFTVRVYCDFSGYSDMALGSALLLGYRLTPNFLTPFLSLNIGEFWRRWHVSLGTWLRDYVFIPLGGSRGSKLFVARNLLITFFLCGLWHGAAWSWVLWGTLNGALLVGHSW